MGGAAHMHSSGQVFKVGGSDQQRRRPGAHRGVREAGG